VHGGGLDANSAIPAAVGYNFRLLIRLRILLALILVAILAPLKS
jgi:hypothetical protein